MTDSALHDPTQPLGAGTIVSQSFSLLFRNLIPIMIVSIVPVLLGLAVSAAFIGLPAALGAADPSFDGAGDIVGFIASILASLVVYGVVIAAIVQLAYDAKLGRSFNYGKYLSAAFATIVPNVVQMLIYSILIGIGLVCFVIPGIWVMAVFSVIVPALVIERSGFGAMSRSRALTKDYRWPIIGAFILIWICAWLLNFAGFFLVGIISNAIGSGGMIVGAIVLALLYSLSYGLSSVATALIYARLREIKEGVSVDNLVAVFE